LRDTSLTLFWAGLKLPLDGPSAVMLVPVVPLLSQSESKIRRLDEDQNKKMD